MKEKYCIDTDENKEFLKSMREGLLSFGKKFPSPSGASYYLGDDGTPCKERPLETWITSRMAHVYSIGCMLGFEGSGELADAALKGLLDALYDEKNGGWYAGISETFSILPGKQCYAHAFVILAATSLLLAGRDGAKELLDKAVALYDTRFWNEEDGLSCDTWNTEFTVLDDYRGINANMHTVEAFLAAADALGEEKYRVRAGRIIDHVINWASENDWRIPEHFSSDWKADMECSKDNPADKFKPYGATPGHGIEWARLIAQWALSTFSSHSSENEDTNEEKGSKEKQLAEYIDAAVKLYNRAVLDGWNADGRPGIVYTTDWDGNPVIRDRMHWVMAEAVNTSAVLYRVTGDKKYAGDYKVFMEYIDNFLIDKENNSWYHQLDENNEVSDTVWPGKPDIYHAFQATLIPYSDSGLSIAAAVKKNQA